MKEQDFWKSNISHTGKLLYLYLSSLKDEVIKSKEDIKLELNISHVTAGKVIKELESNNLVIVDRLTHKKNKYIVVKLESQYAR